jgi:hypothetical protein
MIIDSISCLHRKFHGLLDLLESVVAGTSSRICVHGVHLLRVASRSGCLCASVAVVRPGGPGGGEKWL